MKVEFANGGPVDGMVREVEGTPETILVYALNEPGKVEFAKPDAVGVITHVYRSATRLTKDGATVFDYRGRTHP